MIVKEIDDDSELGEREEISFSHEFVNLFKITTKY